MNKRVIFNGRLDFKNSRNFERVRDLYEQRALNFYKDDVVFKLESLLEEDTNSITIPKHISQGSEKSWKNTVQLLEYISQYAISGKVEAWITDNGKILLRTDIQPQGDKSAITNYNRGIELLEKEGKEEEAIEAFQKAIDKFADHAFAFEKKGYSNLLMQKYGKALDDFDRSLDLYPQNPNSFLGRSRVYLATGDYRSALNDLDNVLKFSVPYQSSFWSARRLKAKAYLELGELDKAEFELRFFTKRNFEPSDDNYKWKRASLVEYAKIKLSQEDFETALQSLEKALKYPSETGVSDADISRYIDSCNEENLMPYSCENILL